MNDKITEIVEELYENARRFLKEDDILDATADLSPIEVNKVISRLQSMGVIVDADIEKATKQKPKKTATNSNKKSPVAATTFEMLNIPVGTELTFTMDKSIKSFTFDNKNKIKLSDGSVLSISRAARRLNRQMGYADCPRQGPTYWMLDGKTLWEIRQQIDVEHE